MKFMTIFIAMLLGGCVVAAQSHVPDNLTGLTKWRLIELDGQNVVAESGVTLSIDIPQMTLSGSAGCNRFRSSFEDSGDRLEIGPVALTKRFCTLPKGIMEQETAFVHVLRSVDHLSHDGESLKASGGIGTLVFVPLRDAH